MSDSKKRKRRDAIQQVAEQKPTEPRPVTTRENYKTYWMTRDSVGGKLLDRVDVWLVRPRRVVIDTWDELFEINTPPDVRWTGANDSHYCQWTIGQAYHEVRSAVPASDMESVIVGEPPPKDELLS